MRVVYKYLVLLCFISLGSCNSTIEQDNERPNIVFILSDDHTSKAWGIYGGELADFAHNPAISRLADEGVVLNNAFCTNSICVPSRASILTGQYSNRNNVRTLWDSLSPNKTNIAQLLTKAGYQTALIGKWHLKAEPSGFQYYNVLHQQGRYWDPIFKTADNFHKNPEDWNVHEGFSTDVVTDLSIDWLKNRNKEEPFMLMTHFKATHEPFDFPDRFKDLYEDITFPEPSSLLNFNRDSLREFDGLTLENMTRNWLRSTEDPDSWWCVYPELPFTIEGLDSVGIRKKTYQKLVKDFMRSGAAIDDNIDKLLNYLDQEAIANNTIVIYTADQGYFLGEHGFYDKRLFYEESLRMPFVIRYPKEIKGGKRIDDIILNIDFPALLADYAGIETPDFFQGKSFRENLKGNKPNDWRDQMYYRYWQHRAFWPAHFGIRNDRYKLIFYYGHGFDMPGTDAEATAPFWEFFDLEKDPKELKNEYGNPNYDAIISEMKTDLIKERQQFDNSDQNYPEIKERIKTYWND